MKPQTLVTRSLKADALEYVDSSEFGRDQKVQKLIRTFKSIGKTKVKALEASTGRKTEVKPPDMDIKKFQIFEQKIKDLSKEDTFSWPQRFEQLQHLATKFEQEIDLDQLVMSLPDGAKPALRSWILNGKGPDADG